MDVISSISEVLNLRAKKWQLQLNRKQNRRFLKNIRCQRGLLKTDSMLNNDFSVKSICISDYQLSIQTLSLLFIKEWILKRGIQKII